MILVIGARTGLVAGKVVYFYSWLLLLHWILYRYKGILIEFFYEKSFRQLMIYKIRSHIHAQFSVKSPKNLSQQLHIKLYYFERDVYRYLSINQSIRKFLESSPV